MHVFRSTTPCVVSIHHIEDERSIAPLYDADGVMTGCHQWHEELLARGISREKCVTIRYGVDVDVFKPALGEQKAKARRRFGSPNGFNLHWI